MSKSNSLDVELPKWPECRVVGKSVTREQAAEIIIRTQDFHFSTNDTKFHIELLKILGFPTTSTYPYTDWDNLEYARKKYKCLPIEFLQNQRICSSYIFGPHGWINWDGSIGESGKNIGKWPSVSEVEEEWKIIAQSFPYLNLKCQLFSGEGCENDTKPLVEFVVKNGKVVTKIPKKSLQKNDSMIKDITTSIFTRNERGCSIEQFKQAMDITWESIGEWDKN